jgi:AraC family transcriptional regulator
MATQPIVRAPLRNAAEAGIGLRLVARPPGAVEFPGFRETTVSVHFGAPTDVACRWGRRRDRGIAVHGDLFVIPADTPTAWDMKDTDAAVVLSVSPELMRSVVEQLGLEPARVEVRSRFRVRDAQLENLAWALKAEVEGSYPSGRLYLDGLAVAVASRLVGSHSSAAVEQARHRSRLPERRLRDVLAYVEEHLGRDVSLAELAAVAGLSVTHFKRLFRESVGASAPQYQIRRRVERARRLLGETELPISRIALESGFSHQSHLALHMRRALGVSPKALREMLR